MKIEKKKEAYLGRCETSMIGFYLSTIFAKKAPR